MIDSFPVLVDYTQILVHVASHPKPGLSWTDEHVAQGFAWSEGIVSFGVPDHDGECLLNILETISEDLEANAIWAVKVPFQVNETLKIGTVFDTRSVNIPQGSYNLIFEAILGRDGYAFIINLKFFAVDSPSFSILKQGGELSTNIILRQDADIAG